MSEAQWRLLFAAHGNKRKDKLDYDFYLLEYLAVLISYDRKSTLEIIKKRRAKADKDKKSSSLNSDGNEHFNTTFYDDIMKVGGESAVRSLLSEEEFKEYLEKKKESGEEKQYTKVELSDEDISFLTSAAKVAKEYEDQIPNMTQGDTIILP